MKTSQQSLTAHSDLENPQHCQEPGSRGEKTPKFSPFPLKALFEIFPNVSDIFLPCLPPVHLIPAWLSLPNREGPWQPSCPLFLHLSQHSASSSILSDVITWLYPPLSLTGPVSPSSPAHVHPPPLSHNISLTYILMSLPLWRSQFNSR